MKTSELTDLALDWAVAKCLPISEDALGLLDLDVCNGFNPSTDWAQGGPIIGREGIKLSTSEGCGWFAYLGIYDAEGLTPLIAAMRCFVASKLGDDVELPEELTP